jgi:hypothetical protein
MAGTMSRRDDSLDHDRSNDGADHGTDDNRRTYHLRGSDNHAGSNNDSCSHHNYRSDYHHHSGSHHNHDVGPYDDDNPTCDHNYHRSDILCGSQRPIGVESQHVCL